MHDFCGSFLCLFLKSSFRALHSEGGKLIGELIMECGGRPRVVEWSDALICSLQGSRAILVGEQPTTVTVRTVDSVRAGIMIGFGQVENVEHGRISHG